MAKSRRYVSINAPGKPGNVRIQTNPFVEYVNKLMIAHDATYPRYDAPCAFRLQSGKIILFTNVLQGSGDHDDGQLGYRVSTDDGLTYGTITLLPIWAFVNAVASPYQKADGTLIVLFVAKTQQNAAQPRSYIGKFTMSADLSSFTSPVPVTPNSNLDYWAPKQNAIFKMPDGTLLYPMGKLIDQGLPSQTYHGRLWKSTDDGDTWTDTNINIVHPTSYVVECGLFLKNSNATLVYYFRTTTGFLLACDITNFTTFEPGAYYNLMPAGDSTTDIKFIPAINKYLAIHNRRSDGITGFNTRRNLQWSTSTDGVTWVVSPNLLYSWNTVESCREPDIFINTAKGICMIYFSRYINGDYDDLYQVIISNTTISNLT